MLGSLATATGDLFDRRILRFVAAAAALGIGCFLAIWFAIDAVLAAWFAGPDGLPAALSWLGALATFALAWFLLPAVTGACLCLFLDRIAAAVEQRHHPALPPATGLPWHQALVQSLRFLGLVLLVNLLLFVLWFVPPVYGGAWLVANGWLLGREYFELVALRRLSPAAAGELRRRHAGQVFAIGLVFAAAFAVPFANLLAPVWATAVFVHRFAAWRNERAAG